MQKGNPKKNSLCTLLLVVLLFVLIGTAAFFGKKVYRYYADYTKDRTLYDDLRDAVVESVSNPEETKAEQETGETERSKETKGKDGWFIRRRSLPKTQTQNAPVSIDWENLKAINEDIIGWVYFTGLPQISYPILQAKDNEYYVHRTFDLSSDTSKAGSIFMDYRMAGDFSSPYSVIYGHNVRDGSMLSDLALLKDQTLYESDPYIWILTPNGAYRYQIFSIFQCHRSADVFQENFKTWGSDFWNWQETLKERNVMKGDVTLKKNGHVIAFSTCVPNSYDRTIVCAAYTDGDEIPDPHEEDATNP